MFARVGRSIVAVTLCLSIGGHWIGLQSIAWANMVVQYSQQCSLRTAVERTFDGAHPCGLCKQINKARETEKKQNNRFAITKTDLICTVRGVVLLPPFTRFDYSPLACSLIDGSFQPPSPPPRTALA
jgi:hypothetical protein